MKNVTVKHDLVEVRTLKLAAYQRAPQTSRVKIMASKFDENIIGTIVVSKRDGQMFIVDGQHRVMLAKLKGIPFLWAEIHEGLTYEEEAKLFKIRNNEDGNQVKPAKSEIFHASVESKDPDSIRIKEIVESKGFKITNFTGNGNIVAVASVVRVYKKHGERILTSTIEVINKAWGGESDSLKGLMLEGMAAFIKVYEGEPSFSPETLVDHLSKVQPGKIIRDAKGDTSTNSTSIKMMNALLNYYNLGLRKSRLTNKHYNLG